MNTCMFGVINWKNRNYPFSLLVWYKMIWKHSASRKHSASLVVVVITCIYMYLMLQNEYFGEKNSRRKLSLKKREMCCFPRIFEICRMVKQKRSFLKVDKRKYLSEMFFIVTFLVFSFVRNYLQNRIQTIINLKHFDE